MPATYIQQGLGALLNREQLLIVLLSQCRAPDVGLDEQSVEMALQTLVAMDTNNFRANVGAGPSLCSSRTH